jgi:hypothetical protein
VGTSAWSVWYRAVRTFRGAARVAGHTVERMQGVEFQGFAGDCTVSGRITMFGERLTDFLNGQERFRLHKVEFTSLDDGHTVAQDSVSVERDDLLAVAGTGPRGNEKQRVSLEEARMQLSVGPYLILGRLHVPPGQDPMRNVLRREPMVPFTGVTMAYNLAGTVVARDFRTIIVNRHLVEWITATDEEAVLFPEASIRSPFSMNLRKDFTGPSTL